MKVIYFYFFFVLGDIFVIGFGGYDILEMVYFSLMIIVFDYEYVGKFVVIFFL